MAQPIAPEVWQEGIDDNRLLPGRKTCGLFTGNGVKIANNAQACRVWDINVSDYITDYDDRRINGHHGTNADGRDGWGASAWGVFQEVRFTSRVYTMGRHRSTALRVFEEMQYSGGVGQWGDVKNSNVTTNGEALMKVAALISKAKQLWQDEVLDVDIDRYNLFAVLNGHISGRCVGKTVNGINYNDQVFTGNCEHYEWVAQPGMMEGSAIPPRFAPIHGIEWDDQNVAQMLNNIKVTWNNLFIPQENRIILIDPFYELRLMRALTGAGVPATDSAYADVQNGSFSRLMGWEFDFSIPTSYWPTLYFDTNLNVVHSADGTMTCDKMINSVAATTDDYSLLHQLIEANRTNDLNFVRTTWDNKTGKFVKTITNYPLGQPWADGYYGSVASEVATGAATKGSIYDYQVDEKYAVETTYPFVGDAGRGPKETTGPSIGDNGIAKKKVIGMALYKPAAQLSQEYSEMRTEDGGTRGKFTEMVFDVKYDAWVIEKLAAGILPIIAPETSSSASYGIPVCVMGDVAVTGAVKTTETTTTA